MRNIENILFYLIILFLPTQFGKHFWPDFSFISGLRIDYLSPTLYVTDILILILFLLWLFPFLIQNSKFKIQNSKFKIVFLTAFLLVGIIFSKNQSAGLYGLLKLLELVFFGYYVSITIRTMKQWITIVSLFSIGIFFESGLGIIQYLNQSSIGSFLYFLGERTLNSQTPGVANASLNGELILRPYGTFSHPNVLAAYLLIGMTLLISNIKYLASRRSGQISNIRKGLYFLVLLIGTVALFLTMSRAAIILWLLILFLQIFSFLTNVKNYKSPIVLIFSFLFLIFTIFNLSPIKYRFLSLSLTDESIIKRKELIIQSILMIKDNPVFGVGLNNFLFNLKGFYLQPVHNIYLLIAAQTGIIGLAVFIWFIIKTYNRIRNKKLSILNSLASRRSGQFSTLVVFLILGLFDHYFVTLQQGQLMFAFVFGLCWAKIKG